MVLLFPAEVIEHFAYLVQRNERIRRLLARYIIVAAGSAFSVLLAPVRMLFHTVFVVSAFLGWEVVWNSPQRDDDSTSRVKRSNATAHSCC